MKAAEIKTTTASLQKKGQPFFEKGGGKGFFSDHATDTSFFTKNQNTRPIIQCKLTIGQPDDKYEKEADAMADKAVQRLTTPDVLTKKEAGVQAKPLASNITPLIQSKYTTCKQEGSIIQRQEQPDAKEETSPNPNESPTIAPEVGSRRVGRCYSNPEFPDFKCFAYALKLDIDENLWNNAHHFYRVASLHPGDNELMWNTFLRYGLGANLLKTSFGFMGTTETMGTVLSYGTGIGLKSYKFLKSGVLELDVPIHLGRGINLDLQLDLNADPNNLNNVRGVNAGVGISGHF